MAESLGVKPSTFEILRRLEAEGLSWSPDRAGPGGTRLAAPDHVGVEMAFLAVTSARQAGGPDGVARLARLRWFPGPCGGLASRCPMVSGWSRPQTQSSGYHGAPS